MQRNFVYHFFQFMKYGLNNQKHFFIAYYFTHTKQKHCYKGEIKYRKSKNKYPWISEHSHIGFSCYLDFAFNFSKNISCSVVSVWNGNIFQVKLHWTRLGEHPLYLCLAIHVHDNNCLYKKFLSTIWLYLSNRFLYIMIACTTDFFMIIYDLWL